MKRFFEPRNIAPISSALMQRVRGTIYKQGDQGYQQAIGTFNTAIQHKPDVVVEANSSEDIAEAIKLAKQFKYEVSVQSTGHGAITPIQKGMMITTKNLNNFSIDAQNGTARISAGVRWKSVIEKAAEHGLVPIAGSSPNVGAIGYMLGGGLGPLARSHGVSSDYLSGFKMVTSEGNIIDVNEQQNPALFWALRGGGRLGFGVVTEMSMRLSKLEKVYGGSIFFEEKDIETVFRGWANWTKNADANVTTSIGILNFPNLDRFPPPLRGRRLLTLRFAYPGDMEAGARLADPLVKLAPIYLGEFEELATTELDKIHNDPTQPGPVWISGRLLTHIDQDAVTNLLKEFGKNTESPFLAVDIRHLGGAMVSNVKSSVNGRAAQFTLGLVGKRQELFKQDYFDLENKLADLMKPWLSEQNNTNLMGTPRTVEELMSAWTKPIREQLLQIREQYDPDGMFSFEKYLPNVESAQNVNISNPIYNVQNNSTFFAAPDNPGTASEAPQIADEEKKRRDASPVVKGRR